MKQLNDISLVTRVAVFHDKKAFDALVVKYQAAVRRFFLSQTLGDAQLSDDLAQDTFIKAYTNIGRFRGLSGFSTWLYRIAYNVLYDYRRSHKVTDDVSSVPADRSVAQADKGLSIDILLGTETAERRREALSDAADNRRTVRRQDIRENLTAAGYGEVASLKE